ncbi:MAG: hypothetical protein IKL83_04015 [Muribaculaceae bacterium]|nr:hypothetical protein [Muribaculaceae bacterium]
MKSTEYTTIILTAEEGKYLTQMADVAIEERIVAQTIALGRNDSADNWREIDKAEADAYRKAQAEAEEAEKGGE